ncbi:MAG: Iron complex transport system substrate-binding protein [Phenylobacterium sp.]|nr:Iron complex transport system substrate-binding protein [Phenylobacterium sp.]
MRIVSLLPAATEMVCALGLADQLVGVSHECAYPAEVVGKPVVLRGVLATQEMSQAEIDAEVTRRLRAGEPIYEVDAEQLAALEPDLVITQELCEVCAASPKDLAGALAGLVRRPQVLQLTPHSLAEIFQNLGQIGSATGREAQAAALAADCEARIKAVRARAAQARRRPRVFCMEWLDPPYCSGHWVPEMVELCHAEDQLSRKGTDSVRVPWAAVLDWAPELLVVMPCGYGLEAVQRQAEALPKLPGWAALPAVQAGRVYAADADALFARPGPRVVEGLELLAHLIHPELFAWTGDPGAFARLRTKACARCQASFLCRPAPGCWCEGVSLPQGTAGALCGAYADCLCPACLEPVAAELTPAPIFSSRITMG